MSRRGRVVTTVALTALGLLLLLWGASSGDPLLVPPSSDATPTLPTAEAPVATMESAPVEPLPTEAEGDQEPVQIEFDWLVVGGLALVLLMLGLIVRALLRRREEDVEPVVIDDELDTLVDATAEPARAATLAQGDPRNAVVACWVVLEDGVARAGLERSPAETSVDLARRVLGTWQVDAAAVTELSELYREARFSRHPVTEPQRARAVAALERIHADLRAAVERRRQAETLEPAVASDPAEEGS